MFILLIFSFISGLITIFAPCIWPLLPVILSSSATGDKRKPLGITLGVMVSFAFFTLTLSYIVKVIPLDPNSLRLVAVVIIGFLGLTLIIPQLSTAFEGFVSRLSSKIPLTPAKNGFGSGFITGFSLGIVWSPCAGPILATVATLAATRLVTIEIILVTLSYVLGIGIPLFLFASFGLWLFQKSKVFFKYTGRIQQVFGFVMILTALAIYTNYDKMLQTKLLDFFPSYSTFLTQLESNDKITKELNTIKGRNENTLIAPQTVFSPELTMMKTAPDFSGITKWLNSDPLTITKLKGKVVLVDFWTYTCINCIRTLPFVTSWYEKYKDKGFVVVGVHTPEFEFEKNTDNVKNALKQFAIHYPVAQDNNYATWNAYENQYWPAEYLIDKQGIIRRAHFGEGLYDETEKAIQTLLTEMGSSVSAELVNLPDQTPQGMQTPETYLGSTRSERLIDQKQISNGGLPLHYFTFNGKWAVTPEYAQPSAGSSLDFHVYANKVFLVFNTVSKNQKIKIMVDGKVVDETNAGNDVKGGFVVLDQDRLYNLLNFKDKGDHLLRLEFETDGPQLFAFTFG